jgi:flagellar hook-associated protein 3 FlgL
MPMVARTTNLMLQRDMLSHLSRTRLRLSRVQEQASTGLRINRPSDDPSGTGEAAALRSRLESTAQLGRNLSQAELRLRAGEAALGQAGDVLIRARELALQGANDTLDAAGRRQIAMEIESLHAQLVAAANARTSGAYLFGGHQSASAPFVVSGPFVDASPAPTVAFVGDPSEVEVEIEEGTNVAATLDGRRVFLGDGDGDAAPDAGKEDLFDVLADQRDALRADDRAAVAAVTQRLDRGQQQLSEELARVGSRSAWLEAQRATLARREEDLTARLSQVQDADSIRVLSDLVREETALQASLEVMARVVQPSLLDFLA